MAQRGEQSGSGTYTYANQAVYDGVWENGRKHGSGYFSSGNQLLLELWCRGVRVKRCEVSAMANFHDPILVQSYFSCREYCGGKFCCRVAVVRRTIVESLLLFGRFCNKKKKKEKKLE